MKYLTIFILVFLLSCSNQNKPDTQLGNTSSANNKKVVPRKIILDTVVVDIKKSGFSIALNENISKKGFVSAVSGFTLYKTHQKIYSFTEQQLAEHLNVSTFGNISKTRASKLAPVLKRIANKKWLGRFTLVFTAGAAIFTLVDTDNSKKMKDRFDAGSKKDK